ncbi:MAG: GlsB/YeaQ/YmgE family stress response membrane protein [Terriglobales bacterium]
MFWLLWVILVGLIAGWAAGRIMRGSGYGTLADIGLGILGAVVGGFLIRLVGFEPMGGLISSIVTATLGAIVVIAIARKLK